MEEHAQLQILLHTEEEKKKDKYDSKYYLATTPNIVDHSSQ